MQGKSECSYYSGNCQCKEVQFSSCLKQRTPKADDSLLIFPKVLWDNIVRVVALYTVLVAPWRVGFTTPSTGLILVWEIIIDVIYVADLGLGFFTGYVLERSNTYERSRALITQRYAKGWLVIDAIAAVPWSASALHARIGNGNSWFSSLQSIKGLRLVPFLWVREVHVFGLHISYTTFSTIKTVAIVFISAHILSCAWFYITCYRGEYGANRHDHLDDHIDEDEHEAHSWLFCGEEENKISQYLAAFYYTIYTMMTVGYGDVIPRGERQMILAIFIEILGVMIFAFIIAATQRLAQHINPVSQASVSSLNEILVSLQS